MRPDDDADPPDLIDTAAMAVAAQATALRNLRAAGRFAKLCLLIDAAPDDRARLTRQARVFATWRSYWDTSTIYHAHHFISLAVMTTAEVLGGFGCASYNMSPDHAREALPPLLDLLAQCEARL